MEYNERDVSDDEQIVEDEHDESEEEEDGEPEEEEDGEPEEEEDEEPEEEEDEEPEGWEDEEKNPWAGIREDIEEWRKKKLEALITEFQKSGDSAEVAAVKAYNSLLPLYMQRRPERCFDGRAEIDTCLEKGPHLSRSSGNQRRINGGNGIWLVRIHTTGHSWEAISTEQAV